MAHPRDRGFRSWLSRGPLLILIAVVLCGDFFPKPALARVIVEEKIEWHEVAGNTGNALRAAIRRNMGDDRLAFTDGQMSLLYRLRNEGGHCRLHDVRIQLTITYNYPKWTDQSGASTALRTRWQRMQTALTQHEAGHADLFLEQAHQLDMMLQTIRRPCALIDAEARQLPSLLAEEYQYRQEAYDVQANVNEDMRIYELY